MGEHKFSKKAKPAEAGYMSREQASQMRLVANLAAILVQRAGGEVILSIGDLDSDEFIVRMRSPDNGKTFIFNTERRQ
jgi:hypothetical protein